MPVEKLELSLCDAHKRLNKAVSESKVEDLSPESVAKLLQGSRLDQIYLAKVADKFKNKEVIAELLKSEDSMVVSKALKCKWFFKKQNNPAYWKANHFMKNILPSLSFSTFCKVVTNLAYLDDRDTAQDFYKALSATYGRKFACKVLPYCSKTFIEYEMVIPDSDITEHQMLVLYKKYPDMILNYVEICIDEKKSRIANSLREKILHERPDDFIRLYQKDPNFLPCKFGYRTSIHFLKKYPEVMIQHASNLGRAIDKEAFKKIFKGDNRDRFIMQLFPKTGYRHNGVIDGFIKTDTKAGLNYYMTLFEKVYQISPLNDDNFMDRFVEQLPVETRKTWAKKKFSAGKDESQYLKYVAFDEADNRYRTLMNSASEVHERLGLLINMMKCCKINDDMPGLLKILKYILKRFRNDDIDRVLGALNNTFDLSNLSSEHWEQIDEILQIIEFIKLKEKNFYCHNFVQVLVKRIYYCLYNNLDIKPTVEKIYKLKTNAFQYFIKKGNVKVYNEKIFNTRLEVCQSLLPEDPKSLDYGKIINNSLEAINEWNNLYKNDKKSLLEYNWLKDAIQNWLEHYEKEANLYNNMSDTIFDKVCDDLKAALHFKTLLIGKGLRTHIVKGLFIHDGNYIYDEFETIFEETCYDFIKFKYLYFLRKVRAYLQSTWGEKLKTKCMEELNGTDNSAHNIGNIFMNLTNLLDRKELEDLLNERIVDETKVVSYKDMTAEERDRFLETAIVLKHLKYANPPVSFDLIEKYAKNDCLKEVLPSMLSICYKKSIGSTEEFLLSKIGKTVPVSLKKHPVRLLYFIYPKPKLVDVYKQMWEGEKSSSIRDVLFQKSFHLFIKNENDVELQTRFWDVIKYFTTSFGEEDKNLYCDLSIIDIVPPFVFLDYIKNSWIVFKKLKESGVDIFDELTEYINNIMNCMDRLDNEICEGIINLYLESVGDDRFTEEITDALSNFSILYLTQAKTVELQQKRFEEIRFILKVYIEKNWDKIDEKKSQRDAIKIFIMNYCNSVSKAILDLSPLPVLVNFSNMLEDLLSFEATFDLSLYLKFTILYVAAQDRIDLNDLDDSSESSELGDEPGYSPITEFLKNCASYFNDLNSKYGLLIYYIYKDVFTRFVNMIIIPTQSHRYIALFNFIRSMLLIDSIDQPMLNLVIDLLPKRSQVDVDYRYMYDDLIESFKSIDDITIKTILNYKIKITLDTFKA